ncbi:MAG: PEP-CTERM sorting domain-containing protein [Pseudomonadota bacterium]
MTTFAKAALSAGTIAWSAPAAAAVVNIDFEEFAGQTRIAANQDVGGGLSFDRLIRIEDRGFVNNAPATVGNVAIAPSAANGQGDDIKGIFTQAVDFLRIGVGDSGSDRDIVTLTGFDRNGTVVDTARFDARAAQFLEINGAGITSFFLDIDDIASGQLDQNGSSGFDNISFNVTPVPLPSSLPLLGFGLFAAGVAARRRAKA